LESGELRVTGRVGSIKLTLFVLSLVIESVGVSPSGLVIGVIEETGLYGNVVATVKANGLVLRDSLSCDGKEALTVANDFGDCSGVRV